MRACQPLSRRPRFQFLVQQLLRVSKSQVLLTHLLELFEVDNPQELNNAAYELDERMGLLGDPAPHLKLYHLEASPTPLGNAPAIGVLEYGTRRGNVSVTALEEVAAITGLRVKRILSNEDFSS